MQRPHADEYEPYYHTYVSKVPDGPIFDTLNAQADETRALVAGLSEEEGARRYAPGKWSVKEVLGPHDRRRADLRHARSRLRAARSAAVPGHRTGRLRRRRGLRHANAALSRRRVHRSSERDGGAVRGYARGGLTTAG